MVGAQDRGVLRQETRKLDVPRLAELLQRRDEE